MTGLEACIRFWESMLKATGCLMAISIRSQIEATIKFLKELQKVREASNNARPNRIG